MGGAIRPLIKMIMKQIIVCICALVCLISCKIVQPIPQEAKIETKIEYRDRVTRDTCYIKDSVFVRQKADTIFFDRWHTQYFERIRIDTAYLVNTDSVFIKQVEYIPRSRTKYDKITSVGFWLLLLLIGLLIYWRFRK